MDILIIMEDFKSKLDHFPCIKHNKLEIITSMSHAIWMDVRIPHQHVVFFLHNFMENLE